jgi:hypothetical protein
MASARNYRERMSRTHLPIKRIENCTRFPHLRPSEPGRTNGHLIELLLSLQNRKPGIRNSGSNRLQRGPVIG